MVQQITRGDLDQAGLEQKEIDRFVNLIDLMKRSSKINLQSVQGPKKKLTLRFIDGSLKGKTVDLDTARMPFIFGKSDNQEVG